MFKFFSKTALIITFVICVTFITGCGKNDPSSDKGSQAADAHKLVIISPHNKNICYEFERAFKLYCKENYGFDASVEWRDVGSGSSTILQFLKNVYAHADTAEIDVFFGGGEYPFQYLDRENLLETIQLDDKVLANIPATFCGMEMYSANHSWCGNVLSSFGFLYNKELLQQLSITPPVHWEDLARPEYFDLSIQGDPTQSGSTAAAFEMIVQSAPDWQSGWERLLSILSNAKKFTDSSGDAANAPVLGEAVISVCIDFYGTMRVSDAPDKLGYVSPEGETGYTPDPVAILKNPPHMDMAQKFINFLLSIEGQRTWALEPGHPDGPEKYLLNRTPISKAYFAKYDADTPEWIARPYSSDSVMDVDMKLRSVRYGVLSDIVRAAAIDNLKIMKQAKKRLIEEGFPEEKTKLFYKLPENIDTVEEIYTIAEQLKDTVKADIIVSDWTDYFRNQYKKVLE